RPEDRRAARGHRGADRTGATERRNAPREGGSLARRRRLLPRPPQRPVALPALQRGLGARLRERAAACSHHRRRAAPQRDADRGNRDRPQGMSMHEVSLTGELHPYYVIDVFTDTPLERNQLGVFPDGQPFSGEQMQRIGRELNLSETVFLLPPQNGGDARMRIFTPVAELPFAGHPILGTAFFVGENLEGDEVHLETRNGLVPLQLDRTAGRVVFGWMKQPAFGCEPYERAEELLASLGVEESLLPVEVYENGPRHVYVRLPDEDAVAALRPEFTALAGHERVGANCFAGSGTAWRTTLLR